MTFVYKVLRTEAVELEVLNYKSAYEKRAEELLCTLIISGQLALYFVCHGWRNVSRLRELVNPIRVGLGWAFADRGDHLQHGCGFR